MRMPLIDLIARLIDIGRRAKDADMVVEFDCIIYLHPGPNRPHRLELIDIVARNERSDQLNQIFRENERLKAELEVYRQAYG